MEQSFDLLQIIKEKYEKKELGPLTWRRFLTKLANLDENKDAVKEEPKTEYDESVVKKEPWKQAFETVKSRYENSLFAADDYFEYGPRFYIFKDGRTQLLECAELMLENAAKDNYLECKEFQSYLENVLNSLGTFYIPSEAMSIYVSAKKIKTPDFQESKEKELEKLVEDYSRGYKEKDVGNPKELISRLMAVCDNINGDSFYYKETVRNALGIIVETLHYDRLDRLEESVVALEKIVPLWKEEFSLKKWNGYSPPESSEMGLLDKVGIELSYNLRQNFLDKLEEAGKEEFEEYLETKDGFETVRNLDRVQIVNGQMSLCVVDYEGIAEPSVKSYTDFFKFYLGLFEKINQMEKEIPSLREFLPQVVKVGELRPDYYGKTFGGWYIVSTERRIWNRK